MNGLPETAKTKRQGRIILSGLILLLSMLMLAFLNTKITVYSDDYWYGTFYNNGFYGFLKNMYSHYMDTNGRLYIHLIVPTVLLFGTKLFAVLSPVLLAVLYWYGAKTLNEKLTLPEIMLSAAFGILCTLSCDVMYLRMTLLWISAYFNYVFPLCMVMLAAFFQLRWYQSKQNRTGHIFGLIFALLAGASTEQCGIMAITVIGGSAVLNRIFGGVDRRKCWSYPIFTLIGFLTILLAPGSWARVDRGVDGGILSCLNPSVFAARFYEAMIYVVKYPSTVVLLAAVDILAAVLCLIDKKLSKLLLLGLPMAALPILCFLMGWNAFACVLAVVSMLLLAVLFLIKKEYMMTGLLILAHVASNMMLIITTLGSERTSFEGIIALIIVAISLGMRIFRKTPKWAKVAASAVVIFVTVIMYIPTIKGYTGSKKIVDENIASVEESRETGVCHINIDIDPRYRFTMLFEGSYFYENFRAYYKIPPETKIVFTSKEWTLADISSEERVYEFPTLKKGGTLYFPVEFAMQSSGGSAVWSWKNHTYDIELGGKRYMAEEDGSLYLLREDGKKELLCDDFEILRPFSTTYTLLYCPADKLFEYIGVNWEYDEENNTYIIKESRQE